MQERARILVTSIDDQYAQFVLWHHTIMMLNYVASMLVNLLVDPSNMPVHVGCCLQNRVSLQLEHKVI